jgi:hypothetical protein
MKGYIYVLTNSAHPDLVKIGRTRNSPSVRASELSTTGVPTPYVVAYHQAFFDCIWAESACHAHFSRFRVNSKREFFRISSRDAIDFIRSLPGVIADEDIAGTAKQFHHLYAATIADGIYRIGVYRGTEEFNRLRLNAALRSDLSRYYSQQIRNVICRPVISESFVFDSACDRSDELNDAIAKGLRSLVLGTNFEIKIDRQTFANKDVQRYPLRSRIEEGFGLNNHHPAQFFFAIKDQVAGKLNSMYPKPLNGEARNF